MQPVHLKQVAARAFGRRLFKKRFIQQLLQQATVHLTLRSPLPILVKRSTCVQLTPAVHQHIARAAIKAQNLRAMRWVMFQIRFA